MLGLRRAAIKEISLPEALRGARRTRMHQECTHNRVFIRTLLQKPLVIQALEWLMIESLHCFAFDCKTIWKWMKSIKDVTWILVKLLSLFGQSLIHWYPPPANMRLSSTEWRGHVPPARPHPSAAPQDEPEQHSFPTSIVFCWGGGGLWSMVFGSSNSTRNKTALYISGNLVTEERKLVPPPRVWQPYNGGTDES